MITEIILVIEDQKAMAQLLQDKLSYKTNLPIITVHSYQEALDVIESDVKIVVCLTDLNLPDAAEGATVPLLKQNKIATVVLTANYREETRQKMYELNVADYVIKDGLAALDYAVDTVLGLVVNSSLTIWMLSKSESRGRYLRNLLSIQRYKVFTFETFDEMSSAMEIKTPDLLILNEVCADEAGEELTFIQAVRSKFSASQLPLMLCDYSENTTNAIKLMKYGVNDFYNLSFTAEEFYVRVRANLLQTLNYRKIETISRTDSLTGLFNRHYFFEQAENYVDMPAGQHNFTIMVDIDFFKKVNDTYGHQKGDEAIVFTAQSLQSFFKDFIVARFGGEEFCVIGFVSSKDELIKIAESFRAFIEAESSKQTEVHFTVSLGVFFDANNISDAVNKADEGLYTAKESGRNQVVVAEDYFHNIRRG